MKETLVSFMDTNYQSILNDATAVISAKDLIIEDIDGNSLVYLDGDGNLAPVTFGSGVSFTDGELSATGSVYNVVSADSNIESKTSGYTTTLTLSRTPTLRYIDFAGLNSPEIRSLLATNNTGRLISIVTSNGVNYDYNDISGIGTISLSGSPSLSGLTLGTYNGLLKATAGAISTAIAGTDYQAAITTGTTSQFFLGDLSLATLDTDSIPEGKSNEYFTTARARGAFTAGSGIDITSGVISATGGVGTFEPVITGSTSDTYWRGDKTWVTLDTSNVPENTNLYYTTSRFNTDFGGKTTDDLTEGKTNEYFTTSKFNTSFSSKTTDDLTEGKTNEYFTNARAVTACSGTYEPVITGSTSDQFYDGTKTFRAVTQADISGLTTSSSPTFTGLTLSGLTGSRLVMTDPGNLLLSVAFGDSIALTGPTLDTIQDIRTTATPQFTRLGIGTAAVSNQVIRQNATLTAPASNNVFGISNSGTLGVTSTGNNCYGYYSSPTYSVPAGFTGRIYTMQIDAGAKSGTDTPVQAYGLHCVSPNVGATQALGIYTDSIGIGTGAWTDRATADGRAYIIKGAGIGVAPATDRTLYVAGASGRTYTQYNAMYPSSSSGTTNWYNFVAYANSAGLSGSASANYYGVYSGDSSGPSAFVNRAYAGYFVNPNFSSTAANNYALYAADLVVGSTATPGSSKPTNGIYCSGNIRVDGLSTASRLLYCDANKILTSAAVSSNLSFSAGTLDTIQGIQTSSSPTFTGLNLSGLTANSLVATDGSKNLTTTISSLSPTLSNLSITNGLGIGTGGYNSNCLVQATGDRLYGYYHNLYSTLSSTTVNRYGYYTLFDNSGLSGTATVNWYGVYSETSTSGSARVGSCYGGYFKAGASSTAANNIALYADDLSVGASNGRLASGIHSSGGIRLGNSANAAMTIYKEGSGTYNYLGGFAGTRSIAIKYVIVGKMVTLSFATDYSTFTFTSQISMSAGILPSEIRPASTKYLPMVVWANNTWATGAITMYTDGGILLVRDNWSAFTNGLINGFINTSITYELT